VDFSQYVTTVRVLGLTAIAVLEIACASTPKRLAPRLPLAQDSDLQSVSVPCHLESRPNDRSHVSCAPRPYVSPLAWDGIDNSIFRPLSDALAIQVTHEARNATSIDEVADSAWFTNRIGVRSLSIDELRRGACEQAQFLDDASTKPGSWVIDQGKANGSSLGFRVSIPGKGRYLMKADPEDEPERSTAATVIGAAVYRAAGFFTSCEQLVYFDPSVLKLTPGLRYEDNTGIVRNFDDAALAHVLATATKRGSLVRMSASAWLPGHFIGPFRYEGTRDDDPNDAVPHEDRRELRGSRLLSAWIDHSDSREQNTMDTWLAARPDNPDSSPGIVRHYYLDTSDAFGSSWDWDEISRRLGRSYLLDWGDIGRDFVTLGIRTRSWERVHRVAGHEKFNYFDVATFDPEQWKNEYPNPAFSRMTERDGAWMARILANFTPEMVRALAEMGQFSDPTDAQFLADMLKARLERILDRYLTRLSPLGVVHIEGGSALCAVDLARRRRVREPAAFGYTAIASNGQRLAATAREDGSVCVALPASATAESNPPQFSMVSIMNGVTAGPLTVHLYDWGSAHGYQVVGVERKAPGDP
jgi:hypothetical protein